MRFKSIIYLSTIFGISLFFQKLQAQQQPQYTQYMYNTMSINSGYTGSTGSLDAFLLYRSQWVGIDGAPKTASFGIQSPISDKVGLGLSVINDKIGPSQETNIEGTFSYSLNLGFETKLAFGVNAGINVLGLNWSEGSYNNPQDPLFSTDVSGRVRPVLGSAVYVYSDKWYGGVSAPNLIKNDFYDDVQEAVLDRELHFYAIAGYVFTLSDELKFKPATMLKIVPSAPVTWDVSANFLISEKVTLGAGYRYDDAISGLVGINISDTIFLGYAYDRTLTSLQKYNDGSHELILKFQLNKKNSNLKSPRFF